MPNGILKFEIDSILKLIDFNEFRSQDNINIYSIHFILWNIFVFEIVILKKEGNGLFHCNIVNNIVCSDILRVPTNVLDDPLSFYMFVCSRGVLFVAEKI